MSKQIDKTGWSLIEDCISQGDLTDQRLEWDYIQEFLRGNHFAYKDSKSRRIVKLTDGSIIPGTSYRVSGSINAPIDPHIITIAGGLEAKALTNWPFLVPQVRAATADDNDRDAAKNSTMLLMYYRESSDEEELYRQGIGYLKPCGNFFIKDYWNKNVGPTGAMDKKGNPIHLGDVACRINAPQKMLLPKGIAHDEDLPWIGEMSAMHVDDIRDTWGVEVPAESNLEELDALKSVDYSGVSRDNQLKNHARVYEIYFRPSKSYPLGRLLIGCNKKVLYDGVWDTKLTQAYPDEWNPYTHIGWIKIEGDYWSKSPLFYVTDHQVQLNRLYKTMVKSRKYPRGYWTYMKQSVNWNRVNWDGEDGTPKIEWTSTEPKFNAAPIQNMDIPAQMAMIRQHMNDITAQYEVTRGNTDPSVTSGKQVQQLQTANTVQHSPLLMALARGWKRHWQKVLRLCAVHYESEGRLVSVTGENNASIAFTFKPDQIRSDNIIIATGQSFFLPPEARNAELDRSFQTGLMGDPNSPAVKMRYMELRGIGGGLEELYADYTADITMARLENQWFEAGDWVEKDPLMVSNFIQDILAGRIPAFTPDLQKWKQIHDTWSAMKQQYDGAVQLYEGGQTPIQQLSGAPPPKDPGAEPKAPTVYRLARSYENHAAHIEILNRFCKTVKFEQMCLQNTELRKATDFHRSCHAAYLAISSPPPIPGPPGPKKAP